MKVLQFLKVNVSALLVLLSLAVFNTGCNDDDPASVSVSKEIILVGSDAQAIPVTIMSNTNWTAESNSPWVRLSHSAGRGTTDIEVLIEACTAVNDRSAMITVKADGKSAVIDVTQSATAGLLVIAPDSMTLDNTGGIVSFVIASNSPWTISSSNDWAVPSVTSGSGNTTVNVAVASNVSHFVPRKATLAITTGQGANAIVREFVVNQLSRALPHVSVARKAVAFAYDAKSAHTNEVLIPIVSNVTGAINAHTEFSWATASVVTVDGVKYVRIVCESDNAENDNRDCIVNVVAHVEGEATMSQIRVTQAGLGSPEIVMFRNTVALDCNAATAVPVNYFFPNGKNISVQAVSEEPRWITNVKVDATKKQITFNAEKNISAETRVGTIMVTATLGSETLLYPITVTQDGVGEADVEVIPASLSLGAMSNLSATASVTSQTAYSSISAVVTDASWLTVSMGNVTTNNGSYAQEIILTATPNALTASRTATVTLTISYGDKLVLRTISVTQAGIGSPYLVLMPQELTVSRFAHNVEGRDVVITYLAPENVIVSAVSTTDWLTMHGVYPNLNKIVLRMDANRDEADRTGIVNVSVVRDGETVIYPVKVTQRGLGAIDVRIAPEVITVDATVSLAQFVVSAQYVGARVSATVTSGSEWLTNLAMRSDRNDNYVSRVYNVFTAPNMDAAPRTGTITVTTEWGNKTDVRTVTIIQNGLGAPAVSTVANAYMLSDQTTHTQSLWIEDGNKNNVSYQVTSISYQSGTNNGEAQTGWITNARVVNHNLVITAQPNTFDEQRDGEITIIASRGTEKAVLTVHVTQAGHKTPGMVGLPSLLTRDFYRSTGNPLQFNMLNNSTIKEVLSSHSWLTVTKTSNNSILYDVTHYPGGERSDYREGVITIVVENGSSNTAVYTVTVHQMSPEMPGILGLPTEIVQNYTATSYLLKQFELQNNARITSVTSSTSGHTTDWLKISLPINADGSITYTLDRYQGGETGGSRVGYIYITVDNAHANEVTYVVPVRQLAPEMPGILNIPEFIVRDFNAVAAVNAIPLHLNMQNGAGVISAITSDTWLKVVSLDDGVGIRYHMDAYAGGEPGGFRQADIIITVQNNHLNTVTYRIPVRQYAPEMPGIAEVPELGVGAAGIGSLAIPIGQTLNPINNATLSYQGVSHPWIHAALIGNVLYYYVDAYSGDAQRSGYIWVKASNAHANDVDYYIPITQYGSTYAYVEGSASFEWSIEDLVRSYDDYTNTSRTHTFNLANVPAGATVALGTIPAGLSRYDGHSATNNCESRITPSATLSGTAINFTITYTHNWYSGYGDRTHRMFPTGNLTIPVTITTTNYTQVLSVTVSVVHTLP